MGEKQVEQIILDLSKGMDREEVARKYGYSEFLHLHTVLNRKGYQWDHQKQNFVKKPSIIDSNVFTNIPSRGKASQIIQRFQKEKDARKIAKELGFKSHREMANYMAEKGYQWDSEHQNYVQVAHVEEGEIQPPILSDKNKEQVENDGTLKLKSEYEEILQLLVLKKDKLYQLLLEEEIGRTIPNYVIPGKTFTKSIQITEAMDQLLKTFSEEKNIPQKTIVQIALIEFFQKYGYKHEIDAMFGI